MGTLLYEEPYAKIEATQIERQLSPGKGTAVVQGFFAFPLRRGLVYSRRWFAGVFQCKGSVCLDLASTFSCFSTVSVICNRGFILRRGAKYQLKMRTQAGSPGCRGIGFFWDSTRRHRCASRKSKRLLCITVAPRKKLSCSLVCSPWSGLESGSGYKPYMAGCNKAWDTIPHQIGVKRALCAWV